MAFVAPASTWLTGRTLSARAPTRRSRTCPRHYPSVTSRPARCSVEDTDSSISPDLFDPMDSPPSDASFLPDLPTPLAENPVHVPPTTLSEHLNEQPLSDNEVCIGEFLHSPSLFEYAEQRSAGLVSPLLRDSQSEWIDAWALAVPPRKGPEIMNQYSRVGICIEQNFGDFTPADGCTEAMNNATLAEIALVKARAVYSATGMPAIAETCDMSIDAPESDGRINKTLQQGYQTRDVAVEGDALIDRVRPVSDENRMTRFNSVAVYFDGEIEVTTTGSVSIAMAFAEASKATIASTVALDNLYKELSRRFNLTLDDRNRQSTLGDNDSDSESVGKVPVGATLLRERILREGKILGDGILKVSSFLNHMVDTDLMEVCGEELAERLRETNPNKVLTVESTGLIAGLPTARKLGIPLVFARKSRPITISDSFQTTYRSSTKGVTSELIVSCEYLESGDRVLIIDDFLAGGSTAEALFKLANMAHAKVVGVGVLIEKMSDGGRAFLSGYDVPVESLAKILPDGDKGRINLMDEEPWVSPKSTMTTKQIKEATIQAEAEYYSRTEDPVLENADMVGADSALDEQNEEMKRMMMEGDVDDDDADGSVDIIRWEDEDDLDELEDELLREG